MPARFLTILKMEAIIELRTNVSVPTPLEWPFTRETNEEQNTLIRLSEYDAKAFHAPLTEFTLERLHPRNSHVACYRLVGAFLTIPRHADYDARFICFIGIAYQLPGAVAGDRANLTTTYMVAMGGLKSARIM